MSKHKNLEFGEEFARRLNARMLELGITAAYLSEITEIPVSTINHYVYEDTHVPSADIVVKLARALLMSTDALINF